MKIKMNKTSQIILTTIVIVSFTLLCSFLNHPGNTFDIELRIESDRNQIDPKLNPNHYAKITGELINNGNQSIKLVLPGDGSEDGWRTPYIKWSVVKENGEGSKQHEFEFREAMRCGNVNSLNLEDIIELPPNQSIVIDEWIGYPPIPHSSGKYRIKLSYENDPKAKWEGLGFHDKFLLCKAKRTDKIKVMSNEINVEVLE